MSAWLVEPEWDEGGDGWFRRSIAGYFAHLVVKAKGRAHAALRDDEFRAALVEWYEARRPEFVRWTDDDSYAPDFPCGEWAIDVRAVHERLDEALAAVAEARRLREESAAYPTLDAWLAALHGGALTPLPPMEQFAGRLVTGMTKTQFCRASVARLRRWPRLCRECGTEFRDTVRVNAARCPSCTSLSRLRQDGRGRRRHS